MYRNSAFIGKILQVVTSTTTSTTSTSSSSFVNTNLAATITPLSTANKVLILLSGDLAISGTATNTSGAFTVVRGATDLSSGNAFGFITLEVSGTVSRTNASLALVDSPSTISPATYTVQIKCNNGSNTTSWTAAAVASIMLLEFGSA